MGGPRVKDPSVSVRPVAKRGRPTLSQASEIDARVLAAARRMFLEDGYAATKMDVVAKAAGVAKGTLYVRYPSKYGLFRAVVMERLRTWAADNGAAPIETADISERLLSRARSILGPMRSPEVRAFIGVVAAEAVHHPELKDNVFEFGISDPVTAVAEDLRDSAQAEGSPVHDPVGMATIFVSSLTGWFRAQSMVADLEEVDCERFASRLVAVVLAARAIW